MNNAIKYKSKYHPAKIEEFARSGYTVRQICKKLNISPETFYKWKREKVDVSDAFERGRKVLSDSLVPHLRKRAKGFSYTKTTKEMQFTKDEEGNETREMVIVKKVKKQYPPDVSALKFFLNNRLPDEWQERSTIEHDVPEDSGIIILSGKISVDEWQKKQQQPKKQ